MVRSAVVIAMALAAAACAEEKSREYVVRLDLDQIAAQTAARDAAPGFESLARGHGTQPQHPSAAESARATP
jgi:hypothetical protein